MLVSSRPDNGKRWIASTKNRKATKRRPRGVAFRPVLELLEDRTLLSGPSAFGHITNGQFDVINGHQEWSDIHPVVFPATQSYLYADQANLNHPPGSPPDTFMLMYDEVGLTTPLGPNQFFTVSFTTVEHENGHDRLNQYSIHIFTDGTITFLENGVVQADASGNTRVQTIGGQQGQVGFGTSPNSTTPHVIAEFQIALSANQTVLNGGYSPDPQFWTSDPSPPPPPPPHPITPPQKSTLGRVGLALGAVSGALATATVLLTPDVPPAALVVGLGAGLTGTAAAVIGFIDPPDPNFTVIAQPNSPSLPAVGAGGGLTQAEADAANALFANQEQVIGLGRAVTTSINRASGAFAVGDGFWEGRQSDAAQRFAFQMASLVDAEPGLLANLQSAFQAAGLHATFTASDVSNFQAGVRANGLPTALTQELVALGDDSAALDQFRQLILSLDPNAVAALGGGSFPALLSDSSLVSELQQLATDFGVVHLGNGEVLPGFNSNRLPGNDDGSTGPVPLGFTVNFFGHNYNSLFVNNNGNVTFDSPLSTFTPFGLSSTGRVIVAPFFADVDTRVGNVVTYGTGTVHGHSAFGVTWPGVGYYPEQTNKLDTFQVVLVDRSDTGAGNFDIEFNYDQIQWETGGASGGVNGLGGSSARVGFSNGTGQPGTFFEVPGSGVHGAFLDSNTQTGLIHIPSQVFSVRSGAPATHTTAAFLQANLDGTTTVQPHSVLIGQEPTLTDEIERIVVFRVQAGLTNSAAQLTNDLVEGLVEDGIVSQQQANQIISAVLQQFPADASITVTLQPPNPVEGAPLAHVVVATLRDADPAGRATDFTATITWGDGSTSTATAALGTITQNADGSFRIFGSHIYSEEASNLTFTVQVQDVGGAQDSKSTTLSVSDPPVAATGIPVLAFECRPFTTVPVVTFTDPGGPEPVGDYLVMINWGDSLVSSVAPTFSAGTFTVSGSHTYAKEGSYTITVTINHEGIPTIVTTTATVKDNLGLLVLDPSGGGALTVTGNGAITVNNCGAVVVNSSDANAATLTGNGNVNAMDIDVTGGTNVNGNGKFLGTIDHEPANPDPIGLTLPPVPSPTFAAVNYSGSALLTLNPGTYLGGIAIAGQGSVVLNPGIYYMMGGGFSVTGKGSVTGSGVMLVNAPAKPNDSINITGDGSVNLQSPPTNLTGSLQAYNGITILQDPASSAPINVTGKGGLSIEGIVYARGATLKVTGGGAMTVNSDSPNHIEGEVVVFDVSLTGNGGLTINADGTSSPSPAASVPSGDGQFVAAQITFALTLNLSSFVWLDYQAFVSTSVSAKTDFGGNSTITPQAVQDMALTLVLQDLSTAGVSDLDHLVGLELAAVDQVFATLVP